MKRLLLIYFFSCAFLYGQKQPKIDLQKVDISIALDTISYEVKGKVAHSFLIKEKTDSLFLNAIDMNFESVLLNGNKVSFKASKEKLTLYKKFKKDRIYNIEIRYKAFPLKAVYFIGWERPQAKSQIWTQGQGKNSSHWVPCLDDMTDKAIFNMDITFDKSYQVVANGKLQGTQESKGLKTWKYRMRKPMSSYLLAFTIGKYSSIETTSNTDTPITLYFYPNDSLKAEPTYRFSKEIFDFLTSEIGVAYPWQNYKQIPVRDFLYAGMENTGTTIFSDAYVIDSIAFVDRNYVNINAHELAHQWFGNMLTELDANHHWLHEGFASYYALLSEREIFGDDYFYWKLYDSAKQLHSMSMEGRGEALNNGKAGSLTFYEKGAWALFVLKTVLGEEAFNAGMRDYLSKFAYSTVRIVDFITTMEENSGINLEDFETNWVRSEIFPYREAKVLLETYSEDLRAYFELESLLITQNKTNEVIIKEKWDTASNNLKERIILNYKKSLSIPFLNSLFFENDIKVRQALSSSVDRVPEELRLGFESLLSDKSYVTQENALYRLWLSFPEYRNIYLNKIKDSFGLPNYNLRLLWLTLVLLTNDYDSAMTKNLYADELYGYTSQQYSYEIRQHAFSMINSIFPFRDQNLIDLLQATNHHFWQFRDYARNLLDELLDNEQEKDRLLDLVKKLNESDLRYIRTKMN